MPATKPASGFRSWSIALGPRRPLVRPTSRTSPASRRAARLSETVGLDRPLSRATWARETGPVRWISSRMDLALIARSRLGVPAVTGRSATESPCYSYEAFLTSPLSIAGRGSQSAGRGRRSGGRGRRGQEGKDMAELAVRGGAAVRPQGYPEWPVPGPGPRRARGAAAGAGRAHHPLELLLLRPADRAGGLRRRLGRAGLRGARGRGRGLLARLPADEPLRPVPAVAVAPAGRRGLLSAARPGPHVVPGRRAGRPAPDGLPRRKRLPRRTARDRGRGRSPRQGPAPRRRADRGAGPATRLKVAQGSRDRPGVSAGEEPGQVGAAAL